MAKRASTIFLCIAFAALVSCDAASLDTWRLGVSPDSPVKALSKANALVIADFNSDGRPDVATVNGNPGELLVLLNRSDGRFATPADGSRRTIGATASGLAAADVNADSRPDLVVCFHDRDEVAVLLNMDNGEFEASLMQAVVRRSRGNAHVHNLAMADMNGDGHRDLIISQADDNLISWAFGDGTGRLRPSERTFPAGRHPYTITVADFNGDGRPDIASPNSESNDLTIGLNDGAANFIAPAGASTPLPPRTLALAAGDVNGDGRIDLIANSDQNQRELTLLVGDGRGGFARSPHSFSAPARCYGQVIADMNGDKMLDLVAPCIDRSSVVVWLAEDPATLRFQRVEFETPGTDSQVLSVADINGDGINDVVTAGWDKPTITVLFGAQRAASVE